MLIKRAKQLLLLFLIIIFVLSVFRLNRIRDKQTGQSLAKIELDSVLEMSEMINQEALNQEKEVNVVNSDNKVITRGRGGFELIDYNIEKENWQQIDNFIYSEENLESEKEKKEQRPENPFAVRAISRQAEDSYALLYNRKDGKTYIVREGSVINNYEIVEIKKDIVILKYEDFELISFFN